MYDKLPLANCERAHFSKPHQGATLRNYFEPHEINLRNPCNIVGIRANILNEIDVYFVNWYFLMGHEDYEEKHTKQLMSLLYMVFQQKAIQ